METPQRDWTDYVSGLTWELAKQGHALTGADLRITSSIPVGSGVSSSAALQIAVLRALRALFALPLTEVELALIAHEVETGFVGAPVGIMDQMACALADESHALLLDTRTRQYERVAFPDGAAIVVIDSGVSHRHASGAYRVRRAECERAAAMLAVDQLGDLSDSDRVRGLPAPLDRRARHVVTENARVLATVDAFRRQDARAAGALLTASHVSMRDDFEISTAEVDLLVELAEHDSATYGARLTGGGFGGAIVALVESGSARSMANRVTAAYVARSGLPGRVLVPTPIDTA